MMKITFFVWHLGNISKKYFPTIRVSGARPRHVYLPPEHNDHPELDTSDLLHEDEISIYQSLIGILQRIVSTGINHLYLVQGDRYVQEVNIHVSVSLQRPL